MTADWTGRVVYPQSPHSFEDGDDGRIRVVLEWSAEPAARPGSAHADGALPLPGTDDRSDRPRPYEARVSER